MAQVIKYSELAEYMKKMGDIDVQAQSELKKIWGRLVNFEMSDAREIITLSMDGLVAKYGDAGALVTAEFMSRYAPTSFEYVIPNGATQEQIEKSIRSAFRYWVEGAKDSTIAQISGALTRYIQSPSREMVIDAAKKHRKVRFAIVPRANCMCKWCLMMAGRGFVYWSRENASSSKFHDNCRCMVVQGFAYPDGTTTRVEGYDPDMLYRRWRHIENGTITFEKGAKPEDKEMDVAVFLADKGHKVKFLKPTDVNKTADADVDGIIREMKIPDGNNGSVGYLSAFNQFKRAVGQSDKLIISEHLIHGYLGDRDYREEILHFWEEWPQFVEVWFVSRKEEIVKLKR